MKILINLSPLKIGGGQNVGLNFLVGLRNHISQSANEYIFLVSRNSRIAGYLRENPLGEVWVVSPNPLFRIFQERTVIHWKIDRAGIEVIYSYFGYGFFRTQVPQVSGSADSNLFYPEIDFWSGYSWIARALKRVIDNYRLYGVKHSSHVVFENESIRQRAVDLYGLSSTTTILPSIAEFCTDGTLSLPDNMTKTRKRILFFCGWQLNKNIMLIPAIAAQLNSMGMSSQIIFTASLGSDSVSEQFRELVKHHSVEDQVCLIGSVEKKQIGSLYNQTDVLVLLSRLESFSNNFIEAWKFNCPIVVTDADWSRRICCDSALYVDRDSPESIANALVDLFNDERLRNKLTKAGRTLLSGYPTISQRIDSELILLSSVVSKGKLT